MINLKKGVLGKVISMPFANCVGPGSLIRCFSMTLAVSNTYKKPVTKSLISVPDEKAFAGASVSNPPKLTHLNEQGEVNMVNISSKLITHRIARATGTIKFSNLIPLEQIHTDNNKKGDVLGTARIAGIMAVKQTSDLIPLCHNILLQKIKIDFDVLWHLNKIKAYCEVHCDGKTGVEMEALTGVNVALLTVYDMCKAVDKRIIIEDVKVLEKSGGKLGDFNLEVGK